MIEIHVFNWKMIFVFIRSCCAKLFLEVTIRYDYIKLFKKNIMIVSNNVLVF